MFYLMRLFHISLGSYLFKQTMDIVKIMVQYKKMGYSSKVARFISKCAQIWSSADMVKETVAIFDS